MTSLTTTAAIILVVETILRIVAIGTVPENRRPSSGTAWLLLILLVPSFGWILFAMIGSPTVHGRRLRIQNEANKAIRDYVGEHQLQPEQIDDEQFSDVVRLNERLTSMPLVPGQLVAVHPTYDDSIAATVRAVSGAQHFVHIEIYAMTFDDTTAPLFDAMDAAVERGVKVRYLYDHIGSQKYSGYKEMKRRLTAGGIEWYPMMPLDPLHGRWRRPDLRNHRKLVVVDGVIGIMGSQNMIDSSYDSKRNKKIGRHWVDTNVEVTGDIVQGLDAVFSTDWFTETGERLDTAFKSRAELQAGRPDVAVPTANTPMQLVPSGPGFPTAPNLRQFTTLLYLARKHVVLVSPYFIPDESLLSAITTACQRGVKVELFASEQADQFMVHHAQRSYYQALLDVGVAIHLYPKPAVLHTKMMTVDDEVGLIGSSNMDMRSFELDYEIMLLGLDPGYAKHLNQVVDLYRERSHELTLEEWKHRPLLQRYLDNAMRLTSAVQ